MNRVRRRPGRLATVEGIDGLSIGRLVAELGMSKSGLYAHFDSKLDLQLATIDTAREIFVEVVVLPVIEWLVTESRDLGQLPPDTDSAQLAFELNALVIAANTSFVLHANRAGLQRAQLAVERLLKDALQA